jgi:penicillin-binding protein 2
VRNKIVGLLEGYAGQRGVTYDKELLEETADEFVQLAALGKTVGRRSGHTRGKTGDTRDHNQAQRMGQRDKHGAYADTVEPHRTVLTGIGTDVTSVTPIAVARYVAALVNGGYVYHAHVVDSVIDSNGNIVEKREPTFGATSMCRRNTSTS